MATSRRRASPSKADLQKLTCKSGLAKSGLQKLTRRVLPFEGEPALRILHAPFRSADRMAQLFRSPLAPIDPASPVEGPDRRENMTTGGVSDARPEGVSEPRSRDIANACAPTCSPTCAPGGRAVAIGVGWITVNPPSRSRKTDSRNPSRTRGWSQPMPCRRRLRRRAQVLIRPIPNRHRANRHPNHANHHPTPKQHRRERSSTE
jgi:hypothetical protein